MILVQWHLIHVTENAPVDKMAHKACQARNSVALNLIKGHLDVFGCDLRCRVMQGIAEMLLARCCVLYPTLTL